jgi:hypothetical protein
MLKGVRGRASPPESDRARARSSPTVAVAFEGVDVAVFQRGSNERPPPLDEDQNRGYSISL